MKALLRKLFLERFLLTAAALLAAGALASGRVRVSEIPSLLDVRLLILFAVLTVAVELGRVSRLFDDIVLRVLRRARTARGLAFAMTMVTGVLAMFLTNDVALFLVIPFTLLFAGVADLDLTAIVILEISSANLVGALTPIGNPQNLFLFDRGGFTLPGFLVVQLPIVAGGAILLAGAAWILLPRRALEIAAPEELPVDRLRAVSFGVLLAAEAASILGALPAAVPLVLAAAGVFVLGTRIREADFSLVFVFALLFVGVAGLERGSLYADLERGSLYAGLERGRLFAVLDAGKIGSPGTGMLLSAALLSQIVSNVPAAMLLAPAVSGAAGFRALLRGVTVGGCGTPVASIANLIGAQLYLRSGAAPGRFWKLFLAVSGALFLLLLLLSLGLARLSA